MILGSNVRTPLIGLQALSRALSQRGIAKKMQVSLALKLIVASFVLYHSLPSSLFQNIRLLQKHGYQLSNLWRKKVVFLLI